MVWCCAGFVGRVLSFVGFDLCSDRWVYMAVTFIAGLRDLI